jgi:hypothetical protein
MLLFWRIFSRSVLVAVIFLAGVDAYAWMGPEAPDRFLSSALLGGIAGLLWALFGATVYRALD